MGAFIEVSALPEGCSATNRALRHLCVTVEF